MKNKKSAHDDLEPFFNPDIGTWHEVAQQPLTEPKTSSLEVSVFDLKANNGSAIGPSGMSTTMSQASSRSVRSTSSIMEVMALHPSAANKSGSSMEILTTTSDASGMCKRRTAAGHRTRARRFSSNAMERTDRFGTKTRDWWSRLAVAKVSSRCVTLSAVTTLVDNRVSSNQLSASALLTVTSGGSCSSLAYGLAR